MKIAVLEEHADLAEMLQHALEVTGYSVVVYSHPAPFFAAVLIPAPAAFDCLIVDLPLMEGLSGGEVVQGVRKIFPALPVILIVDGSSWEIEAARGNLPGVEVLRKPFRLASLLSLLKQLAG